jgi:hypothetical protein
MEEMAKRFTLVFNHSADALKTASEKAGLTLKQLIRDRLAAGVSEENIRKELLDELAKGLEGEYTRHFGPIERDFKEIVYGASQRMRSEGMRVALEMKSTPETLYRWQTNGVNVCEDCLPRHGEVDTLEAWVARGMPQEWGSRCGSNCQCTLVAEDLVMEPIQVGQE